MDVKLWEQQISNKENVTNQTKGEKIKFAFFCARLNFYIAKLRFRFSLIFDLCTISNDIFRWYYRVWMCKRRQQKRKGKRDSENKCKKQHIEQIYWIISDLTDLNDIEWIVWLFTSFEKKNSIEAYAVIEFESSLKIAYWQLTINLCHLIVEMLSSRDFGRRWHLPSS